MPAPVVDLFILAYRAKVGSATLEFSGSGDSGDYDGSTLYDLAGNNVPLHVSKDGVWVDALTPEHKALDEALSKWFDDNSSNLIDWDWYNNEGGGGEIAIDFSTGKVDVSGYYNVQETHDADGNTFNILGLEDEE